MAVVLLAGGVLWWLWLWRPVGNGPAGAAVDPAPFRVVWTRQPVLLVGIGDSVTAGFGASRGFSYFDRLGRSPTGDPEDVRGLDLSVVFPNLTMTNLAMSGSTTLQALRAQLPRLGKHPTNVLGVVTVTLGGNDLIHNYGQTPPVENAMYGAHWDQARPWMRLFEERLEILLSGIELAFPGGCWILLGDIYDPSDGTGSLLAVGLPPWRDGLRIHAEYNRILRAVASRHPACRLVEIHGAFLGHGISCRQFWRSSYHREDPSWWYHANVEDPNDRGYDALRRQFLNSLAERAGQAGMLSGAEPAGG